MIDETTAVSTLEINDANGAYKAVQGAHKSQELTPESASDIQAVRKFVEAYLPPISQERLKEPAGLISPAHLVSGCLAFAAEETTPDQNRAMALDQAARLLSHAETTRKIEPIGDLRQIATARSTSQEMTISNLVEVPTTWKRTPEAETFQQKMQAFLDGRKSGAVVTEADLAALRDMQTAIGSCYQGMTVSSEIPLARDLILVQLGLLAQTARRSLGTQMAATDSSILQVQSIKGLFGFSAARAESEVATRGGPFKPIEPVPAIIPMPSALKT